MDETPASIAKTAEREKEKKKQQQQQRNETAATPVTAPNEPSKDVSATKTRSRARSIWGRKKSAVA